MSVTKRLGYNGRPLISDFEVSPTLGLVTLSGVGDVIFPFESTCETPGFTPSNRARSSLKNAWIVVLVTTNPRNTSLSLKSTPGLSDELSAWPATGYPHVSTVTVGDFGRAVPNDQPLPAKT
jgi:hypothetical protein